jgi:hypothetical protein
MSINVKGVDQTLTPARPAETMTGIAGIGGLLAIILGINDPEAIAAMFAALSVLPALVTGLITNGGIVGFGRRLLYGRGDGN